MNPAPDDDLHRVVCHLDELLARRGLTLVDLAARAGITVANLSVLKNGRARAVRFSTLTALCDALDCSPGELFTISRPAPRTRP
ncbi:helix-turn-helix domain-containing protein [Cellulomonas soli]|uniref:helix-turn-helix domain-containing protein n=1 Tax=Cellulomonas soli TaxID=931535 RepID=UPI003F84C821